MTISEFKTLWELDTEQDSPADTLVLMYLNRIEERIYDLWLNANPEKFITKHYFDVSVGGSLEHLGIEDAGSGHSVSDVLTISGGTSGTATITSVDGSGGVTGLTITTRGTGYSIDTDVSTTSSGAGTGTTVNIKKVLADYSLPSDFWHIKFRNTGLFNDKGESKLHEVEYGSSRNGFYFENIGGTQKIVINTTPSAAKTILLRYVPYRTEHTATSDTLILPDRYGREFYLKWYSFFMNIRDTEYTEAQIEKQFADEAASVIYGWLSMSSQIIKKNN